MRRQTSIPVYTGAEYRNPIHALTQILGSLRRADGTVAVEGFYDDVVEFTAEERPAIARVPFEGDEYLGAVGPGRRVRRTGIHEP